MNEIYLTDLHLSGFRAYTNEFNLSLPKGPGLTIIAGANGLGKSTLFDAIEWAITGAVSNLDNIGANSESKKIALGDNRKVNLSFSNGKSIHRDRLQGQSPQDVASILRDPTWGRIEDVANFLRFTQFHGQPVRSHFVHAESDERWQRLSGPARLDEWWSIQQKLTRKQTSQAINRIREDIAEDRKQATREISEFETMKERRDSLQDFVGASDVVVPDAARPRMEELLLSLKALSPLPIEGTFPDDIMSSFSWLKTRILDVHNALKDQNVRLQKAGKILERIEVLSEKESVHQSQITALEREHTQAINDVEEMVKAQTELNLNRQKFSARLAITKASIDDLDLLQRVRRDQSDIKRKLSAANERLHGASQEIEIQNEILSKLMLELSLAKQSAEAKLSLESKISVLQELRNVVSNLETHRLSQKSLAAEVITRSAIEPAASQRLGVLTDELDDIVAQRKSMENELARRRLKSDSISDAVTAIAAALSEDDLNCPVCKTVHGHSELKRAAVSAAALANRDLASLQEQLQVHIHREHDIKIDITKTSQALDELKELQKKLATTTDTGNNVEAEIRQHELLTEIPASKLTATIAEMLEIHKNSVIEQELNLSKYGGEASLADTVEKKRQNLQTGRILIEEIRSEIENLSAERLSKETDLSSLLSRMPVEDTAPEQFQGARVRLLKASSEATSLLTEHEAKLEQTRTEIAKKHIHASELEQNIIVMRQDQKNTTAEMNSLKDELVQLDFAISLTRAIWEDFNRQIITTNSAMNDIDIKYKKMMEGVEAWKKRDDLHDIEGRINDFLDRHGVDSEASVLVKLQERLKALDGKGHRLEEVYKQRTRLSNDIKKLEGLISEETFDSLNQCFQAVTSSLLTGFEHKVELKSTYTKSAALAGLWLNSPDGDDLAVDPRLYLSEGQLSAINVALLISASITYPWSRWRALLLDDPLQYNDTIHSAALIDLLRNLIQEKGYQIIISTHDMTEAEFFERKCINAGIETQFCHLLGKGKQGVAWETRY